ncbi:hypothetical protein JCM18901_2502 [Psychrobacter sp. JCM 18901]|uniref:hypothetical protein n=1 Tax=Psychrobacter sp. JCM 18901 TaxID=1298609 RepID=UPI000433D972|nr:hypothetical protein [Psychrobacter sp. JCM 18901]GAF56753.1 hypothetical protein JCM18901_2502 [Psychrobacter sp. JCM 18901]
MVLDNLDICMLDNLESSNKVDKEFFLKIISEKDLPFLIYKNTSKGYPWGEWLRVAEKIECLALKHCFFDDYSAPQDISHTFNLFYFFPSYATRYQSRLLGSLMDMPWRKLVFLLNNKSICSSILEYISKNTIKNEYLQNYLFVLWSINKNKLLSKEEEISLLEYIIANSQSTSIFKEFINKRLKSLKVPREDQNLTVGSLPRYAIVISGQFRFNFEIEELLSTLFKNKKINVQGVFIASWNKTGGIDTSQEGKVYRYLDETVVNLIKAGQLKIEDVVNRIVSYSKPIDLNKLDILNTIPNKIKLNNENEYPYNIMSNPEKMYFNNEYWLKTLGEKYFTDNFDFLLKIRPDVNLKNIDLDSCINDNFTVFAEEGYIFRYWGFGMGDQIIFGNIKNMIKIMSAHSNDEVCKLVSILYPTSNDYMGHVNLGIAAWLHNINVDKFSLLSFSLKLPPKLSIDDLKIKV